MENVRVVLVASAVRVIRIQSIWAVLAHSRRRKVGGERSNMSTNPVCAAFYIEGGRLIRVPVGRRPRVLLSVSLLMGQYIEVSK